MNSDTDILLLLDCCYAAQAARGRQQVQGKFEILAAASMDVKTRGAGDRSFTSILLREMELIVKELGYVSMKHLHGRLCDRKHDLFATPVLISLKTGHQLRLEPLQAHNPNAPLYAQDNTKSFLHLLVEAKEAMTMESAGRINEWLGEDIPHFVSGLEVFEKTEHIHHAVQDLHQGRKRYTTRIGATSKEEIAQPWATLLAGVEIYQQSNLKPSKNGEKDGEKQRHRAAEFLCQLDHQGSGIVDALEKSILAASGPEDGDILKETIEDETICALGIDSQLNVRRMIMRSESHPVAVEKEGTQGETLHPQLCTPGSLIMQEVRAYGFYINPADMPALQLRLSDLARLLGTPKSKEFRSLQCVRWSHQEFAHTYTLEFMVPSIYKRCKFMDLHSIIRNFKAQQRPTLNERMRMASAIAKAVQKWHRVGWVHQGISSHNIIFFFKDSGLENDLDYSEPFLKGFEFSRPNLDPSIGRAVDDMDLNVYRHPARQGVARQGHQKKHDIYSLGVILLEIGLWQCATDLVKVKDGQDALTPIEIQSRLGRNCSHRLAHFAGMSYRAAVNHCLTLEFGVDMDDNAGSRLASAFQFKVLDDLIKGCQP